MPQLNPAPWFLMFFLAWTMFIIILSKMLMNTYQPEILTTNQTLTHTNWPWPWY